MTNLVNRFTVLVPQNDNEGNALTREFQNKIMFEITELTSLCGGYTATMHEGAWYSHEENKLMIDNIKSYEFFYHIKTVQQKIAIVNHIDNIIKLLVQELKQEAVSIRYNDTLKIYYKTDSVEESVWHIKNSIFSV